MKPACISAHTLRARARAATSRGHSALSGKRSATYSAMARVSHTASSPSSSTGTVPLGFSALTVALKAESQSKESKRTITSSNGMPACLSSTHGRMDHEE